jgi:cytochrome d ubiquinol oxidase subunit I
MREERTKYAVGIPKLGSLILTHDWNGTVRGLEEWPRDERPNATIVFWSFRVMVGLGLLMLGMGLWSLVARARGRLYDWPALHRAAVAMGPAGFVAVIAGWITTEVGRQPWTIYGHLTTAESVSPLAAPAVGASLVAFVIVYTIVFGIGVWYILRLLAKPPPGGETGVDDDEPGPVRTAGITPGPAQGAPGDALPAE